LPVDIDIDIDIVLKTTASSRKSHH